MAVYQSEDEKIKKAFTTESIVLLAGGLLLAFYISVGIQNDFVFPKNIVELFKVLTEIESIGRLVGTMLVIYLFVLIFWSEEYRRYMLRKHSRIGREHGSAKLMGKSDFPRFYREFFYDPVIAESIYGKESIRSKTVWNAKELKRTLKYTAGLPTGAVKRPYTTIENKKAKLYKACFLSSQILAQGVYVSMNCKFLNRNLNTLTIGGSGQGKSYSELFPNALNANSNYVFCDPSGEILQKVGRFLKEDMHYTIKVFNVKDFDLSMRYNPLSYIETEKDYNIFVDALNRNIRGEEQYSHNTNRFFEDAKDSLLTALIALLKELYPNEPEKVTLFNVMELLRMAKQEIDEDGKQYSTLDKIFERVHNANRRSFAAKAYDNFKVGGPKVCNEVIISASAVLGRYFDSDEMANLVMKDELFLYELASEKRCALFIIIPQDTKTYNFMASLLYSQIFTIVTKEGEHYRNEHGLSDPAIPRHLSFWMDEFGNTGKVPAFLELLSVVRKYNISINIIIQTLAQLRSMYKDGWETIVGNCDTMIYLGGQEPSTVRQMSQKLGKETIKAHAYSTNAKSTGQSYQNMAHTLLSESEIEQMSRSKELVFITGLKPFMAEKYNLREHPNYKRCGEYSKERFFDVRTYKNTIDIDRIDDLTVTRHELLNIPLVKRTYGSKHRDRIDQPTRAPEMPNPEVKEADIAVKQKTSHHFQLDMSPQDAKDAGYFNCEITKVKGFSPDYEFS